MKKNAMLKIAAILMVAVLLTTCAISSTFAKYVTGEKASATSIARAAKWGLDFEVKGSANALFTKEVSNTGLVIKSEDSFVVAPVANAQTATGENAVIGVTVSGKPEVAYRLLVKPTVALDNWYVGENNDTFYCPVTFKFGSGNEVAQGSYTEAEFETAISVALATAILGSTPTKDDNDFYYVDYAAFTTPVSGNTNMTWDWEFDGDTTKDLNDTALGNAAADSDLTNDPTISISFVIKAEQIAKIGA